MFLISSCDNRDRVTIARWIVLHVFTAKEKKTMITKKQLDAVIKAVNAGGDDDDEITEDEVITILRDTGLDTEIPYFQELFAWERSRNRPH